MRKSRQPRPAMIGPEAFSRAEFGQYMVFYLYQACGQYAALRGERDPSAAIEVLPV